MMKIGRRFRGVKDTAFHIWCQACQENGRQIQKFLTHTCLSLKYGVCPAFETPPHFHQCRLHVLFLLYVVSYEKIFYASEQFFAEGGRGGGMSELRLMLLLLVYPFKASSEQQSVNFCKTDKLTFLETIWQFLDFSKCRKRAPKNLFKAIAKAALLINFQRESLLSLLI